MKSKGAFLILIFIISITSAFSQDISQTESTSAQKENQDLNRRHSIGSSLFVLFNFLPDPPSFYQLNYGYKLTQKDVILVEAITWTYPAPLGIPYWSPAYESPGEFYPGKVRAFGIGVGYKRFLWKNLYSMVQATPFLQYFLDSANEIIQSGFQLFLQLRLGYRLEFFKRRFFLEPSVAFNYWPINTNFPASFAIIENGWPNYFLFEPGLHFGFKF